MGTKMKCTQNPSSTKMNCILNVSSLKNDLRTYSSNRFVLFKFTMVLLLLTSCSGANHNTVPIADLPDALIGSFSDDYGSTYTISQNEWHHGVGNTYRLISFDPDGQFIIAQNAESNPTDQGRYSRIDIMYFNDMEPWLWGYCLTSYNSETIQDAIDTSPADRSNPRQGCNGFPFTRMKKDDILNL